METEAELMKGVLSSTDHQAALNMISQLGGCQTREQINRILKISLIPLIGCSGAFYARLKGKSNTPKLLDTINSSSFCQCQWQNCFKVATQNHLVNSSIKHKNAVSLSTENYSFINNSCQDCLIDSSNSCNIQHRCCAVAVLFDYPTPSIALYLYRFTPQTQYYNTREIELLKLMRTTIIQTVKAVIYQEQYRTLQHILNSITGDEEPLAVVHPDGGIVYSNPAFNEAIGGDNRSRLLSRVVKRTPTETHDSRYHNCHIQLDRCMYEVRLKPINSSDNLSARLHLLRFTRVIDKKRQFTLSLEKAGLTKRELEIAALIYQGISTRKIAEQINLSYHTIRNHIKHIYSKIGVSSRSEMMAWEE